MTQVIETLSENLLRRYRDLKGSRSDRRPVRSNTASKLAWPCPCNEITGPRYAVLRRLHWEAAPLPTPELQMIYDEGNLQEKAILRDLQDAGFELIEQQTAVEWKQFQITGHLDAKILLDGEAIPLEVKSLSPFSWEKHRTIDDMMESKWPWMRGYPGQLLIYMLLSNAEHGVLVTKNKATGRLHAIDFELMTYLHEAEGLLQVAEQTNMHLAAGTVPDPVPFEEWVCGKCDMFGVCQPPIAGDPPEVIDDPDLLEELTEREQLDAARKRYDALDKKIKAQFDARDGVHLCGDFAIETKITQKERKQLVGTGEMFDSATVKIKRYRADGGSDE
jgi:hypothetical protein